MSRPRVPGTVKARLSLDPDSYKQLKARLKELERAVRKEIIEQALTEGGSIIHDAASASAPGPGVVMQILGGRSLRKRVDPKMAGVVKSNGKFVAIGPDRKHWYYRFFEFGAKPHDIAAVNKRALTIDQGFARSAKQSGGVKMRPFLRPAVDQNADKAVQAMGDVLRAEIEKAAQA